MKTELAKRGKSVTNKRELSANDSKNILILKGGERKKRMGRTTHSLFLEDYCYVFIDVTRRGSVFIVAFRKL